MVLATTVAHSEVPPKSSDPANGRTLWRHRLVLAAVILTSVASAMWYTRDGFFFQDDFVFVRQAQTTRLSLHYLATPLFQHFSPFSRLANLMLVKWFGTSYAASRSIELVLFGLSLLAFAWTVNALVEKPRWVTFLTLLFGQSLALVHLLGWWTATINILPATLFGLLTMGSFFRFRRSGAGRWIVLSLICYALSLTTHEQAWLVPGYLLLFDIVVLAPHGRTREALARTLQEWRIWAGFAVLTGIAMANYFESYFAPVRPRSTAAELARYVGIQFSQSFAPSATGIRPLTTGWTHTAALFAASIIVAITVIVTIVRRRQAIRPWIVFAVGFVANSLMIGGNRVGFFGPGFGRELYYVQAPVYLFLLCAGCAAVLATSPATGASAVIGARTSEVASSNRRRRSVGWTSSRRILVFVIGIAAYETAFLESASAQAARDFNSVQAHSASNYFKNLLPQLDALDHSGVRFSLLDGPAPMVASAFAPFNQLSSAVAMLRPDVRFNELTGVVYAVTTDGHLVREHFVSNGPDRERRLTISSYATIGHAVLVERTGQACFRTGPKGGSVILHLRNPVAAVAWLALGIDTNASGEVQVGTMLGDRYLPASSVELHARQGATRYLAPITSPGLDAIVITGTQAGQVLCSTSVDVGTMAKATSPRNSH